MSCSLRLMWVWVRLRLSDLAARIVLSCLTSSECVNLGSQDDRVFFFFSPVLWFGKMAHFSLFEEHRRWKIGVK